MNRVKDILGRVFTGIAFGVLVTLTLGLSVFADGKVTVNVDSAYIRSSASTSGTVVGSAAKNDSYDIISSETDSSNYTWYKIQYSDSVTGYIRGDLVTTSGVSTDTSTTTTTTTSTDTAASTAAATEDQSAVTECEPVGGSVTADVRVRAGASTVYDVVTTATANTAVTVVGYTTSSDGNTWYQVTYTSGSDTVNGYIRSDYIKLDGELTEKVEDPEPVVEEPVEEEPVEEEEVYKDYEAVYNADDDTWYLNNYIEGNRSSIPELLEAKEQIEVQKASYESQLKKKQVAIIILAIVIVLLMVGGLLAYLSFRKWYFGSDEETEEPVRRETSSKPEKKESSSFSSNVKVQNVGATPKSNVMPATVGSSASQAVKPSGVKQTSLQGEPLADGSIRMPDGSIRKGRVGVKLADGSIKFTDGSIRKPDGTMIKPEEPVKTHTGASSQEVRQVPYSHTSEANSDDDMEYGFLDLDDSLKK